MKNKIFLIIFFLLILISTVMIGCGNSENKAMKESWKQGKIYVAEQNYPKAIEAFQNAVSHIGNTVGNTEIQIIKDKAEAELEGGYFEQAIEDYTVLIQLEEDITQMYIKRGFAYERQGELKKALEDYQTAVANSPNDAEIYDQIADLLQQWGYEEEAEVFRNTGAVFTDRK